MLIRHLGFFVVRKIEGSLFDVQSRNPSALRDKKGSGETGAFRNDMECFEPNPQVQIQTRSRQQRRRQRP